MRLGRMAPARDRSLVATLTWLQPRDATAAYQVQQINEPGRVVNGSSGSPGCIFVQSQYFATYTDSLYYVDGAANVFLLLDASAAALSRWAIIGTLTTELHGLKVRPFCPLTRDLRVFARDRLQGMTFVQTSVSQTAVYAPTALADYAAYAALPAHRSHRGDGDRLHDGAVRLRRPRHCRWRLAK
jgi:hypothetical protein